MDAILAVDNIGRRFGGVHAVRDLHLHVDRGEVVGLIGPNGAGKTTAINLITGFIGLDKGSVKFDGTDVTGYKPHRLARLGLVRTFQQAAIYPGATVLENVLRGAFLAAYRGTMASWAHTRPSIVARKEAKEYARLLLDDLDLSRHAERLAGSIPYGHQKTLGLAHALASKPRLLLLDEPAAGLNHDEASHVRAILERINRQGISILVVDHNIRFMSGMCRRLIVMVEGTALVDGPPSEVLKLPAVVEAYLGGKREPA